MRARSPLFARLQHWATPLWRRLAGGCHLDRATAAEVAAAGFALERIDASWAGVVQRILTRRPAA